MLETKLISQLQLTTHQVSSACQNDMEHFMNGFLNFYKYVVYRHARIYFPGEEQLIYRMRSDFCATVLEHILKGKSYKTPDSAIKFIQLGASLPDTQQTYWEMCNDELCLFARCGESLEECELVSLNEFRNLRIQLLATLGFELTSDGT